LHVTDNWLQISYIYLYIQIENFNLFSLNEVPCLISETPIDDKSSFNNRRHVACLYIIVLPRILRLGYVESGLPDTTHMMYTRMGLHEPPFSAHLCDVHNPLPARRSMSTSIQGKFPDCPIDSGRFQKVRDEATPGDRGGRGPQYSILPCSGAHVRTI
jgi:hypothetical protein